MAKVNKNYCNGCIYSQWRAGVDKAITDKLGREPHPHPTHTCQKLGMSRPRNNFKIDRIPECVDKGFASYQGAM